MNEQWNRRIKIARKRAKISLDEISQRIKVSKQSLIQYEKGIIYPRLDVFCKICELCNVSPNYILYGQEENMVKKKGIQEQVLTLSLLLYSGKIQLCSEQSLIKLTDEELLDRFNEAVWCLDKLNINNPDDFETFIRAIKKM